MDGCGLQFSGEVITSANVAALLLYNRSPEGATICIAPKEAANASAILWHYVCPISTIIRSPVVAEVDVILSCTVLSETENHFVSLFELAYA